VTVTAIAPPHRLELDTVASEWQVALDAAQHALDNARRSLPPDDLVRHHGELVLERRQTAALLAQLAHAAGIKPEPWLSAVPLSVTMLGLRPGVRACIFDLDGVLSDSGVLHAAAWAEVFDGLLLRRSEKTGWQFIPFDRKSDYRAYIDGRPRLEGIHLFLGSRGIRLPERRPGDEPDDADTASGLARHKSEAVARAMRARGVAALDGARRYLEAAGHAGLGCAVVSGSVNTLPMLELAGLATLVDVRIDAELMDIKGLRSRPAPDILLEACRVLGVRPEEAVTFTHSPDGVVAGHAAGLAVIGVGDEATRELLHSFGAERAVPSLAALLDLRLAAL
jgi:HAD superfamily hydrolase (TIGR01509 family)